MEFFKTKKKQVPSHRKAQLDVVSGMDPSWLAMSALRKCQYSKCIAICDEITATSGNKNDQAVWALKCKAVIKENYIDDIELDEESVAEMLMDENATAAVARPGTSLSNPQYANKNSGSYDPVIRPVTNGGRPVTGFTRPASSRPMSGSVNIGDALQSRGGISARPMTNLGREIRLGTASLSSTGALVDVGRLNIKKYASKPGLAMILFDYLLYVEHNIRKALELCAEATKAAEFKSWYWKAKLGKCYLKLGLLRDAEQQLRSSLLIQPIINTYLDLCNVYIRLDLPNTALDLLNEASQMFTAEPRLILGIARIYDMLNDHTNSVAFYKKVLVLDSSHVEAIACLGAHYFYADQPEMAIRYYRRLLQMGVDSTEIWSNIGLSCFYAGQYDMTLTCFDRAIALADDTEMADVWYNVGHIGIALGDKGLAYQAFKVALSIDPQHGESLNNLAVLEMGRQKYDLAKSCVQSSSDFGKHLFEPLYNNALMSYRFGHFQEAYTCIDKALSLYPNHVESKELKSILSKMFSAI